LIIGAFTDKITAWESASVPREFMKHANGMAGKFALKPTALQSLVFNGST